MLVPPRYEEKVWGSFEMATMSWYLVIAQNPVRRQDGNPFVGHPDHLATGEATLAAVYPAARDRLNFPEQIDEGLEPHNVKEIMMWGNDEPNFAVDVTDVVETKIQALLRHASQFGEGAEFLKLVRERWKDEKDGRYYERFRRVTMFR